jgi:hypothetical protein
MKTLSRSLFLAVLFSGFLTALNAQTVTTIPDTEAAQHVGQQATVEGTVVKVFSSKNGNTFLNFGAAYPNQTFTGWIPKDSPLAWRCEPLGPRRKKGANLWDDKSLPG